MKETNYSVGLDIGTTKIVAIIGKENEYGKIEILGIGKSKSLGVHRGVVNNITQTIESIQQAVSQAETDSGLKIDKVSVGIAVTAHMGAGQAQFLAQEGRQKGAALGLPFHCLPVHGHFDLRHLSLP